jgi:hypothetical protein
MKASIPTYVDNNYLDTIRFEKLELVSAIAELIDNSIGSYFRNKPVLDEQLRIDISWNIDEFIIQDNAGGISLDGFKTALLVSPKIERNSIPNDVGQYGLGMKKSALWIGNTIEFISGSIEDQKTYSVVWPKRSSNVIQREADLETINDYNSHGLRIRITNLNEWNTNNFVNENKIKRTLESIFRKYIIEDNVYISVNTEKLTPVERIILKDRHVSAYNKTDDKRKHCLNKHLEPIIEWKLPVKHSLNGYSIEGWLGIQKSSEIFSTGVYVYYKRRGVLGFNEIRYNPYTNDLSSFNYKRLIGELEIHGFEKPPMGNDMPQKQNLDDVLEDFKGEIRTGKIEVEYPLNHFFDQLDNHRKTMIDAEPCIKRTIGEVPQSAGINVKPQSRRQEYTTDSTPQTVTEDQNFTIDNITYVIDVYHSNKISFQIEDNESIIKIEICHPKKINIDNLYLICYIIHYHTQTEEVFSWGDEYLQSMLEQLP